MLTSNVLTKVLIGSTVCWKANNILLLNIVCSHCFMAHKGHQLASNFCDEQCSLDTLGYVGMSFHHSWSDLFILSFCFVQILLGLWKFIHFDHKTCPQRGKHLDPINKLQFHIIYFKKYSPQLCGVKIKIFVNIVLALFQNFIRSVSIPCWQSSSLLCSSQVQLGYNWSPKYQAKWVLPG